MNPDERKVLFFTSAAHFLTHFYMLVFPVLIMPMSRSLGLPLADIVNISFLMYLLYGALALLWGWISDHWGHKWAMSSGNILAGLGFILAGSSGSVAAISLSFALVGAGCSAYHPSGIALVSQGIRMRGKALGINGMLGNAGMASVPFVVGLLNYFMGWQKSLLVLGVFGLVFGTGFLAIHFSVEKGTDRRFVEKLEKKTAGKLFLLVCIGMVFSGLAYRSFTVILPAFLEFRLGGITDEARNLIFSRFPSLKDIPAFATLTASLIATSVYIAGIAGQALGGRVADRFSLKWSYFFFFVGALPFVLGMAIFAGWWLVVSVALYVLFSMGMQPVENSLIAFLTPARWRSVSYGLKFTLAFGAGSFAVKLIGWLEASRGLESVIWLIAGFLTLAILSTALLMSLSRGHKIRQ